MNEITESRWRCGSERAVSCDGGRDAPSRESSAVARGGWMRSTEASASALLLGRVLDGLPCAAGHGERHGARRRGPAMATAARSGSVRAGSCPQRSRRLGGLGLGVNTPPEPHAAGLVSSGQARMGHRRRRATSLGRRPRASRRAFVRNPSQLPGAASACFSRRSAHAAREPRGPIPVQLARDRCARPELASALLLRSSSIGHGARLDTERRGARRRGPAMDNCRRVRVLSVQQLPTAIPSPWRARPGCLHTTKKTARGRGGPFDGGVDGATDGDPSDGWPRSYDSPEPEA